MNKKLIWIFALFLLVIPFSKADLIASDSFESNTLTGGYGWEDNWAVTGSVYPWYASHDSGTYSAFLNGKASITRTVDTSSYSNVKLGFWVWAVATPISINYTVGGVETNLFTITTTSPFTYYEYDLPSGIISLEFSNDGYSSVSYIDDITINGDVGVTPEVFVDIANNIPVGTQNVPIDLSSTETNTLHTLELRYSNNTIFCSNNLMSPSTPNTVFSTSCDMPQISDVDSYAYLYVTNDESINTSKYFNVLDLTQDQSQLNIDQIYYSPQVLQGGSTEIFAIISGNVTTAKVLLTYPDNTTREIYMSPTQNLKEYRAFITDTYKTGNVTFKIDVLNDNYYDSYQNYYTVVAYNVDFVDLVNQVGEVLVVKKQTPNIDVLGTYYEIGDTGKAIAQLSEQGAPINNATCFASIYHPDNTIHIDDTLMSYIEGSDGLYIYDLVIPPIVGVYPISVVCDYIVDTTVYYLKNQTFTYGTNTTALTNSNVEDGFYYTVNSEVVGSEEKIDVIYSFENVSLPPSTNDFYVRWIGNTDIPTEANFYWWDYNESKFEPSNNVFESIFNDITFKRTDDGHLASNYVQNGVVLVKVNFTTPQDDEFVQLVYEDFEDGSWVDNGFTTSTSTGTMTYTTTTSAPLSGTRSFIMYGDFDSNDELGYLNLPVDTTGITNITLSYIRQVVGAESSDNFYVQSSSNGGGSWTTLESWVGNTGTTTQTYNLGIAYDNNPNVIFRWVFNANFNNDEFRIDNIDVSAFIETNYVINTDLMTLEFVSAVGVVNEIRGGGELNVKNITAKIHDKLDTVIDNTDRENYYIQFVMPNIYATENVPIVSIRLNSLKYPSDSEENANCSYSIFFVEQDGNLTNLINENDLINRGDGKYYIVPQGNFTDGIYQIEVNCKLDNGDSYYAIEGFRMEYDYITYFNSTNSNIYSQLGGINTIVSNNNELLNNITSMILDLEVTLANIRGQQTKQYQFTDESIYLITDAITALEGIKNDVIDGKISSQEAKTLIKDIEDNINTENKLIKNKIEDNEKTNGNRPLTTPNELYISYINGNCVTFITNEGKTTGNYVVTMTVNDFLKDVQNIRLKPNEQKQLNMPLSELKEGKYTCRTESVYGEEKSIASLNVNYIKSETNDSEVPNLITTNNNQKSGNTFTNMMYILLGMSMLLHLLNVNILALFKEEKQDGKENFSSLIDVAINDGNSLGSK